MICNNCDRLPSNAFRNSGRFLTMLRKFNICDTRAAANFAVLIVRVSEAASWDGERVNMGVQG